VPNLISKAVRSARDGQRRVATNRAVTRDARARMAARDINFTQARLEVLAIRELADCDGLTFAAAEAEYDDPRNQVMCDVCGWTFGMVCPECPGCGCYNGQCSGWRHSEYRDEYDPDDPDRDRGICGECGYETNAAGYGCACR
jgi:hypothetical protein